MSRASKIYRGTIALGVIVGLSGCSGGGDVPGGELEGTATGTAQNDAPDAGSGTLQIGFLGALSGPFTIMGEPARNGMLLAAQDINGEGGADGRSIEIVEADTASSPEEAMGEMERMVEGDVVAVGGVISSDVGLATSRIAEAEQIPLFLVKAGSNEILTKESRYTFRTCLAAADMHMEALGEFIEAEGYTRVGAIIADYAWGQSISAATEQYVASLDGVEVEEVVAPVGETDFNTYVRQLADFDPQVIIATGHPPGVPGILRTTDELGIGVPIIGPSTPRGAVMEAAGQAALGRHIDFSCADFESDGYQELAARYQAEHGTFMEDDAVAGYAIVTVIAEAVEQTGSTDRAEIAEYIRSNAFSPPGYAWELSWTDWGEFASAAPLLTVTADQSPPDALRSDLDWWPEVIFQSGGVAPYEPE